MPPSFSEFLTFLYAQFFLEPAYPTQPCTGKTIIITGANIGLGYEAARHFVRLGADKVILGVRSVEKGDAARASIEHDEQRNSVVEVWELDLSRYESVKAFAKRVDTLDRVDVVVENAGVATEVYTRAEDNESTITINVVSTFLLALLVLPALKRSASRHGITPTLTIVSSDVHFYTDFPERNAQPSIFAHLNDEAAANMADRYNVSKLLEVLVVRALSHHMDSIGRPYPITLNTLTPGFCHSSLVGVRESEGTWRVWGIRLMKRLLARTTEVGSRTLVHAGLAGRETHGEYMADGVVAPTSPFVRSEEGKRAQERVWNELSEKLEAIQPGILGNL